MALPVWWPARNAFKSTLLLTVLTLFLLFLGDREGSSNGMLLSSQSPS
jgi:hypothetical protein